MRKSGRIKARYILLKVKENNAKIIVKETNTNLQNQSFHSNEVFLGVFLSPGRLRDKKKEHEETVTEGRLEACKEHFG